LVLSSYKQELNIAIARCDSHGKPKHNVKAPGDSDVPHLPVGYPNSGVVCGKRDYENAAVVWLKEGRGGAVRKRAARF
jgi:hypothetical protein